MTARLLLLSALVCAVPAQALEPLSGTRLAEQCAGHERDPASLDTAACRSYVQGFVAGAFTSRVAAADSGKPMSAFMQRALRTRVGEARAGFGQHRGNGYCVPAQTTISEVVAHLNRDAANAEALPETASLLVLETLRRHYPCPAG